MTTELQRAMAQYEEARIRYQKAVLASLDGGSSGEAIRQAIVAFQAASVRLKTLQGVAPAPRPRPQQEAEVTAFPGWALVRRLLQAS
jgi:hypothetical protein